MGRSPCCEKAHTNKGAWTKEEDQRLVAYIKAHGEGCWRSLPKAAGLQRCGKSCRLRWINYLRPDLKRGNFTGEEDDIIIKLHQLLGNKWSLIAARLPGRTDNEIKNYWNTHIKRKLLARGIDPKTHRPLSETAAAGTPTNRQSQEDPPARSSCSPEASGAGHSSDEDSAATGSLPETSQQQQQLTCIDLNLSISPPRHEPSSSSPPPRPNEQGSSTMSPCCEKAHTNKGAWTKEEDQRLVAYIKAHGEGCWRSLPKAAGLQRCGKSCRLRWINYLRPDLKRGNFTGEEDDIIIKLHQLLGNKWSLIAARLPGRTDNEIKNYWNTHIKRKLLARGIDPKTHRPLSETAAAGTPTNRQSQEDPPARSSCSPEASGAGHSSDEDSAATGSLPETSQQQQQLTCIDLNLSISPPRHEPSSSSPPPRPNEQGSSTMSMSSTKGTVGASTSNSESERICLCLNRLGLQCDERCTCSDG
ncbi:hypothetical protein EJB05_02611, partial [Eragrostis curvula]